MIEHDAPHVVVIGGGTGSFTLLQELKNLTPNISAIVNMSDDGGSTGRLRDELGVLPPGDVRQCLVALSDRPEVRGLFNYRFGEGTFAGHSLGNIILSGLELQHNDFIKAVKVAGAILGITGQVVPATTNKHELVMQDGNEIVRGEFNIGHRLIKHREATVWLEPNARIHPDAEVAIVNADQIVIAPGNVYGSLLPALAVDGMKQAFQESDAQKVIVANLMSRTYTWNLVDYVHKFEEFVGKDQFDTVLWNVKLPEHELFMKYWEDGEFPIDLISGYGRYRHHEIRADVIMADLLADEPYKLDPNDKAVPRTLIRHDPVKVGRELMKLIKER